jgi:hypothetical protein
LAKKTREIVKPADAPHEDVVLDRFEGYRILQNGHTHPLRAIKVGHEILVIGFSTWKDQASLDIRLHFLTPIPDQYWQPTKQGIRVPLEDAVRVLDFIAAQAPAVKLVLGELK